MKQDLGDLVAQAQRWEFALELLTMMGPRARM